MAQKKKKKKITPLPQKSAHTGFFYNRFIAVSVSLAERKDVFWFFLALVLATVVYYYPDHGGDYDIWWHLRYGEQFVSNGTWHIDHADFSWSPAASDWKKVTWLGSALMYLVFKAASFQGLYLVRLAVFAGIVSLFLRFIRHAKDSFDSTHLLGLFLFAIAVNPTAIFIKPEVFTILFFSLLIYCYFTSKLLSKNLFYLYPVIFVLWVNIHGAFVIGLFFMTVVLFLELIGYAVNRKTSMKRKLLIRFALYAALSYAVLALNPYGVSFPIDLFQRLLSREKITDLLNVGAYINRWQYLFPETFVYRRMFTAWSLVIMELTVLFTFLYAYVRRSYFDLSVIVINVGFFYLSMQMARAVLFFPPIWLFTLVYVLAKAQLLRTKKAAAPAAYLMIAGFSGLCLFSTLTMNTYKSWFGLNMNELVPEKEVNFIIENKLPKPVFNDYLTGGYMIWSMYPDYRVFIDPRQQPYMTGVWDDFLHFRSSPGEESLKEIVSKYPCKTALIHHISYGDKATAFVLSPDWELVFLDTIAAVFVHASELDLFDREDTDNNLRAEKFSDEDNPRILYSLFGLYLSIDRSEAQKIAGIYKKNVSPFYLDRDKQIATMERFLR